MDRDMEKRAQEMLAPVPQTELDKKLTAIATKHIYTMKGREDLEQHFSDELDFFDVAAWEIKAALHAAYELGKAERS